LRREIDFHEMQREPLPTGANGCIIKEKALGVKEAIRMQREEKKPRKTLLARLREREKKPARSVKEPESQPVEAPLAHSELTLPLEHPFTQLWTQSGFLRPPRLSLTPPPAAEGEPELLPPSRLGEELTRLELFVRRSAERRLKRIEQETVTESLPPPLDAEAHIFLTSCQLTAWALVYPPSGGGADVTAAMLRHALTLSGVCYGVDEAALNSLPQQPNRYFNLFLLARGDAPLHGRDGYVDDMFSRSPPRPLIEDAEGQVDFSALELFQNAKKGDVICRIFPPSPCRDGRTVRDEICYAKAGVAAYIPRGRNTELTEDGTALIATREGHVEFSGRSFQVKPVMDIDGNVDAFTGNISCLGDIHIHGDVCSGFSVRATGNITVDGVIESSVVEAGSDLVVRKGVQGNGHAVLRAHRSIYARYIESCSIYARENVEAENIINCDVFSDGSVKARSGRGTILGGQIRAANLVTANIVGARSEMTTEIFLGGRPYEAFERETLELEIQELEASLEKPGAQDDPARRQQMSKMRLQISANKMKLQQFQKELERASGELPPEQGYLRAGIVYPGVEITIGAQSMKASRELPMCTASLVAGNIVFG